MRNVCVALIILLCACAQQVKQGHPILASNVSNFARAIEPSKDFAVMSKWISVLEREPIISGSGEPTYKMLYDINNACNNKPYKIDFENHVWPTAKEFKRAVNGDCKGFSICKYYTLRRAGFKPEQLNLWAGDYNGIPHMVLVAELDGKEYVLDIGIESNLPLAQDYFYKHFQPAYRFNEKGWDIQ